jgi:hypothetical protein
MRKSLIRLVVLSLTVAIVALPIAAKSQTAPAKDAPKPAKSPSAEVLAAWNDIGRRLVDMAEDFPEDKYDFKTTPAQRTFAENLLHVASDYCLEISAIKGSRIGPAVEPEKDLTRKDYPTKASVVKLLKQVVADGAAVVYYRMSGLVPPESRPKK